MTADNQIKYISHQHIDKVRWDDCIRQAPNGLIYAFSYYLDTMAKNWDALVLNDYEVVMPLTWNSKYGFSYLYQPGFTASLGVFGKNLNEELVFGFIKAIPEKFKLIEISLNSGNFIPGNQPYFSTRTNYILDLNKPFTDLANAYRENHQRNIKKALQAGCTIRKNIPVNLVIEMNQELLKTISPVKTEDYNNFKKLYDLLAKENNAETFGVIDADQHLVAAAVFFYSHNRAYYILAGNTTEGKNLGASHALLDSFIKENADKDLILDFEGSYIESLAFFYTGFGPKAESYPALRTNKLPWYIRWMKG